MTPSENTLHREAATPPVAIVTGASRGFGRAVAVALLDRGWTVAADARRPAELKSTASALDSTRLITLPGDVTDASHRTALVSAAVAAGPLRLLVNNASRLGPSPQPALADYPLSDLQAVYATNVFANISRARFFPRLSRFALAGRPVPW
jgi:NAD(P)-dependent dehydrogenase (short-subunit alcohol dehydrogenase family)